MRLSQPERRLRIALEPARLVRWEYVGRLSLASAILITAFVQWSISDPQKTLIATLTFVLSLGATFASFAWSDVRRLGLTRGFHYVQCVIDVAVVTAVVHVTDGQFAALYILINAVAAIVLPVGGALLIAALGIVLYSADVALLQSAATSSGALVLQLSVFALAGVGTAYISALLKAEGAGRDLLAAELKRVRLREADILANIRSGIISVGEQGELLFANAAAEELLGEPLEPWLGRPVLDVVAGVAPGLAAALRRATRDGVTTARSEGTLRRADIEVPLGVTTTATADGATDAPRTITAIFQDISDQKRLEQLNLRAQRLEAVAELSASLAHEIKNPLASIRSATEQIAARPAASEDERTLGGLIVRESDRLSRLLSEFLDFARVRVTKREPVDVESMLRAAVALAEAHPGRADGARVAVTVTGGPIVIRGDEDLIHRAVFNLVLNALQATAPGTTVAVTATVLPPARVPRGVASLEQGALEIVVADHGPGLSDAVRDRLFEPFTTTKVGGTGLGLAITHRAIDAHRGVVLVDSTPEGTRFSALLPLGDASQDSPA